MEDCHDFSNIYEEYYSKIFLYLKRLVGDQEAEDLAQIVFEKISQSLNSFQGASKLSTWIYQIATNAALDRLKSPSYKHSQSGALAPFPIHNPEIEHTLFENTSTSAFPENQIIRDEMNECVREFIDRLPPDYKTIITLNELKFFTNKEIAEILQISLDTAKIRLHRARAKLKESLESGCDFEYNEQNKLVCDRKQSIDQD
jgi:RNA polymerase sigma-70 factor (ECF subfamily)